MYDFADQRIPFSVLPAYRGFGCGQPEAREVLTILHKAMPPETGKEY
jgi:hypothetical protein